MSEPGGARMENGANDFNRFGWYQIGWRSYCMLCIAVSAQLITIWMTWELWEVRSAPPNLPVPLFEITPFSVAVFMVVSLIGILIDPIRGCMLHILLMVVACWLDQYRMQPQFLATIVLMLAPLGPRGRLACYWFLTAMWFWAGTHKLLSPDWFAHASYWILERADLGRDAALTWHKPYAAMAAVAEISLACVTLLRPRMAAYGCAMLHVGIVITLLWIDWNFSVIPWNLATAVVGFWLLSELSRDDPTGRALLQRHPFFQTMLAIVCFLPPVGFYWGYYDHGYANVLYSDFLPRGQITFKDDLRSIHGWDVVRVPFPSERRLLRQYFECVGETGSKLHIHDPRPALPDQFFVLRENRTAVEIEKDQFFSEGAGGEVLGVGIDDRHASFLLRQWGVITQSYYRGNDTSRQNLVSYGYSFYPQHYRPQRLRKLAGLPNLRELQLAGCAVEDEDLRIVAQLSRLTGIGLNNTAVTDRGLRYLAGLRQLELVEVDRTRVSPTGLKWLKQALGRQMSLQ